jgi:hypothetical protein
VERWIWYHIAGFALTVVLAISLDPIDDALGFNMGHVLMGVSISLAVGLMEWAMLRKYGIGAAWIGYTVAGFTLAFVLLDIINMYFHIKSSNDLQVTAIVAGAFRAALFQYSFILRRFNGSGVRWVLLYMIGWTAAYYSSMSVSIVPRLPVKGILSLPIALILIFSGAVLLAWITSGYLRSALEKLPELPEAEMGQDLI